MPVPGEQQSSTSSCAGMNTTAHKTLRSHSGALLRGENIRLVPYCRQLLLLRCIYKQQAIFRWGSVYSSFVYEPRFCYKTTKVLRIFTPVDWCTNTVPLKKGQTLNLPKHSHFTVQFQASLLHLFLIKSLSQHIKWDSLAFRIYGLCPDVCEYHTVISATHLWHGGCHKPKKCFCLKLLRACVHVTVTLHVSL